MTSQPEEMDEDIFKLKLDINFLKDETCEDTWLKEEKEIIIENENEEILRMKSYIISSKIEANETTRVNEETGKQLARKNDDYGKMEEEIVSLRQEVELLNKSLKSYPTLDEIINHN